jgi:hypothetical protein
VLEDHPDSSVDGLARRVRLQARSERVDVAGLGHHHSGDNLEERALASPVFAADRMDATGMENDGCRANGDDLAVSLRNPYCPSELVRHAA